jgi:hypothetical protein
MVVSLGVMRGKAIEIAFCSSDLAAKFLDFADSPRSSKAETDKRESL